jgi:hypothetical protein
MKLMSKPRLAKGQVWKTGVAHIEIMALNDRFIHYKVTRQLGRRHISAQVSGLQAMEKYLHTNSAQLVKGSANN